MRTDSVPAPLPPVIAIVDDEEVLRDNLARFLEHEGFVVWTADSAEQFYRQMAVRQADLVIVDLGLPGEDGLSLIAHLRNAGRQAILALTARSAVADRIAGLHAGADYYFVKPVDPYELVAAMEAVLRSRGRLALSELRDSEQAGQWRLLRVDGELVTPQEVRVRLTATELALLELLMRNRETVMLKTRLLELLYPANSEQDFHAVEVLLSRLRSKVQQASGQRLPVRAVFGKGLAFIAPCMVVP